MPFTAEELENINNSALEHYIDKGKVFAQNVANKPMLAAFNKGAGKFSGGKEEVSIGVKSGQGGGALQGYTHDDQVGFYNPTGTKRAKWAWKEHHIGTVLTHTELKTDGVDVEETGASQETREMSGREEHALANLLDEKHDTLGEDYAFSLDDLIHGDGTTDTKALAGIGAFVLADPTAGSTGGLSRSTYPWWRNRAATAAFAAAGGQGEITVNPENGGSLLQFLQKEWRQLGKFANGQTRYKLFAGSDFIDGYEIELRANGKYSDAGWQGKNNTDGGMDEVAFKRNPIQYDPTLDRLGLSKRMYVLDMGKRGVRLLYMDGQRMKKHHPARPYDRYVMYNGITTTAVMCAKQLNTSAVYDIA